MSGDLKKFESYGSESEEKIENFDDVSVEIIPEESESRLSLSKCNPKKWFLKRLPIVEWLPHYTVQTAVSDFIAGVTVGLTAIPQGIAYALVANLPPQYGLYSAFMGCFMYCLFGSSKDITVGPTAIMSLLTSEHVNQGTQYMLLLTFMTGIIILGFGLLKLGFVIDFISMPVTAGFTSAAAITIAAGQVSALFGLELKNKSGIEGLTGTVVDIVNNFDSIRLNDTLLGLNCTIILLLMRSLNKVTWFKSTDDSNSPTACQSFWRRIIPPGGRKYIGYFIWILATGRNAVVVIVSALIAYTFDPVLPSDENSRNTTFILTGNIESGLPPFGPPPFQINNTETGEIVSFGGIMSELGSAVIIIPLLGILENVAIAKAFAGGKTVDASQEMIALGMCNLAGSFVSSMPTTGSFSRTAVNHASGVKTPFGGIYTGILVLLALGFLMDTCAYIPKATLAAVIITAVIFSVEYEVIKPMWKSKKLDLIPAFVTFFGCLFWALEYGILVGVGVQLLFILYGTARPSVRIVTKKVNKISFLLVTPDRSLDFPSISYIRGAISKAAQNKGQSRWPVVIDCSLIPSADFTAAKGLKSMVSDFHHRHQPLIFFKPSDSFISTFMGVSPDNPIIKKTDDELHQYIIRLAAGSRQSSSIVTCVEQSNEGYAEDRD